MLICGGVLAAAAVSPALAQTDPQAAIRATLLQWTEAFNARDSSHVCDLFAPDLRYDFQGASERHFGTLCDNLRRALADRTESLRYAPHINEILVSGDIAIVRLIWTVVLTRPGRTPATSEEIGLDVFRRQPDGGWKIIRYLAYPAKP